MSANSDAYTEFKELQEQMSDNIQDLTSNLILAYDKTETSLMMKNGEVSKYLEASKAISYKINTCFVNMIGAFNKAYASIQNNIDESIEGLSELICDQDDKLRSINDQLSQLVDFLTYRTPSTDYTTKAKYMLDNIKTENGSTIKGKIINIQNLALILMKYDEMMRKNKSKKH